jgi:hypothetical protein
MTMTMTDETLGRELAAKIIAFLETGTTPEGVFTKDRSAASAITDVGPEQLPAVPRLAVLVPLLLDLQHEAGGGRVEAMRRSVRLRVSRGSRRRCRPGALCWPWCPQRRCGDLSCRYDPYPDHPVTWVTRL